VDAIVRKYLWLLDLVVVGLCAVFLGRAASSAVESKLLNLTPVLRSAPRVMRTESQTVYTKQVEEILKRNIFCSTCPPILPAPEQAEEPRAVDLEPQRTTLPLELVNINYAPPPWGFQWSSAVLRDADNKFIGAYGVGEKVKGATITGIDETRVHLDNAGRPEFLDLLEGEGASSSVGMAVASTPAASPAPASNDPLSQELDRGIKSLGEHKYEIQRSTLEAVLGNMSLLSRSARIVPEIRDGKAAGFRLYSVRPEGPFAKIGMQNGDVISSINGLEITSPEKALEVYAKLKSASHLSVGLERNGQRITKDYGIR
jgi:general secretion pathway protein C